MSDDPSWDDIFGPGTEKRTGDRDAERHRPAPTSGVAGAAEEVWTSEQQVVVAPDRSTGRRSRRAADDPGRRRSSGDGGDDERRARPPGRRRRRRWGLLVFLLIFLLALGGTGAAVWSVYGARIQEALGIGEPIDYDGDGNGTEVDFVINSGDIGETVARNLAKAGVTKTFTAPYRILLKDSSIRFDPGTYALQEQMSAKSAIAALTDPKNRLVNKAVIPEGSTAEQAFVQLSAATEIPVADFQAAAKDYAALGVPAEAPSIEGFLFPATYQFDPGVTATQVLQQLTGEMTRRLDADGVPVDQRFRVVTLASIVQREAGSEADMPKVARVFQNRLDTGMRLESDATVHYGTGSYDKVTTTDSERANAGNRYNTYANDGLPIGPIGLPGDAAIKAALNPVDGPWLYFVSVNLKTGETVFSTTLDEHESAVRRWQAWCRESDENMAYCR